MLHPAPSHATDGQTRDQYGNRRWTSRIGVQTACTQIRGRQSTIPHAESLAVHQQSHDGEPHAPSHTQQRERRANPRLVREQTLYFTDWRADSLHANPWKAVDYSARREPRSPPAISREIGQRRNSHGARVQQSTTCDMGPEVPCLRARERAYKRTGKAAFSTKRSRIPFWVVTSSFSSRFLQRGRAAQLSPQCRCSDVETDARRHNDVRQSQPRTSPRKTNRIGHSRAAAHT